LSSSNSSTVRLTRLSIKTADAADGADAKITYQITTRAAGPVARQFAVAMTAQDYPGVAGVLVRNFEDRQQEQLLPPL
jgi:hypothetical protein